MFFSVAFINLFPVRSFDLDALSLLDKPTTFTRDYLLRYNREYNLTHIFHEYFGFKLPNTIITPLPCIFTPHAKKLLVSPTKPRATHHMSTRTRLSATPQRLNRVPAWEINSDGRLVRVGTSRPHLSLTYSKLCADANLRQHPSRAIDIIDAIDVLLFLESIFIGQKFLDYFRIRDFINYHQSFSNVETIDLTMFGAPTKERLHYLFWKEHLSGWCERSQYEKVNAPEEFTLEHSVLSSNGTIDIKLTRYSIWRRMWGSKTLTWNKSVTLPGGGDINIFVHEHELVGLENDDYAHPDDIGISPRTYYKPFYEKTLEVKLKTYMDVRPFKTLNLDDLYSHEGQIIPIDTTLKLIREGQNMRHCIGGEDYIKAGLSGENLYFRFIPSHIYNSPERGDTQKHITVTMSRSIDIVRFLDPSEIEDSKALPWLYDNVQSDIAYVGLRKYISPKDDCDEPRFKAYSFIEAWGFENEVPDESTIKEIYQFIWNNRHLFTIND